MAASEREASEAAEALVAGSENRDREAAGSGRNRGRGVRQKEQGTAVCGAVATVAMASAANSSNGKGRQRWRKLRQRRGLTTMNQKAADIAVETAVTVAISWWQWWRLCDSNCSGDGGNESG